MSQPDEYVAILRCQTWNVWPEKTGTEFQPFFIDYGSMTPLPARLIVLSYVQRSSVERYVTEETELGPLVWDGEMYGLHQVRNSVLKAPEDTVKVEFQYRNIQRGEVDILINFRFEGELPSSIIEALSSTAYSIMSLINLKLADFLVPTAPFQIRKVLLNGGGQMESAIRLFAHNRQDLSKEILESTLTSIANVLNNSVFGEKLRTALELYAAHFTEQQVRVRFLLLVIAMESLAKPIRKHDVALSLLDQWQQELEIEKEIFLNTSEEYKSLESLRRELNFRSDDSLRSQIRKLFVNLPGLASSDTEEFQRRALHVYDKRSALVHDGRLPDEELAELEEEARELLEKLFVSAIDQYSDSSVAPSGRNNSA